MGVVCSYFRIFDSHPSPCPASSPIQFYFLGSSRIVTQVDGTVCYDADFTPFGAERAYTNSCNQNNYKFEGKERDAETQNDDFGARYYTWRFGRWLSADWSNVPAPVPYANLTNPQTLNLYAMVADDPESFADLDGHQQANSGSDAECHRVTPCTESKVTEEILPPPNGHDDQRVLYQNKVEENGDTKTVTTTYAYNQMSESAPPAFHHALQSEDKYQKDSKGQWALKQHNPGKGLTQDESEATFGGSTRVYDMFANNIRTKAALKAGATAVSVGIGGVEFVESMNAGHYFHAAYVVAKEAFFHYLVDKTH